MKAKRPRLPRGLYYTRHFVSKTERQEILDWLATLHPIWERRFSTLRPPPEGEAQRWLLRPVYWLGNWQFACLDYYHPPKGVHNRCIAAEDYPPAMRKVVDRMIERVRNIYSGPDLPAKWEPNTCLINFYGSKIDPETGKKTDVARVGEHRDFEHGPVASLSFGERAFFQFVTSRSRGTRDGVVFQQWLEDSSMQIFGTPQWKDRTFHRVQRVENKLKTPFVLPNVTDFEVRRINFTFRYVPREYIVRYKDLPKQSAQDIQEYMKQLAQHSAFFARELGAISR